MKQFTSHHNILQPLVSRKSNPNCYQPNILCIYSAHILRIILLNWSQISLWNLKFMDELIGVECLFVW